MRTCLITGFLLCGLSSLHRLHSQDVGPNLLREAAAIREEIARNKAALRQYTWTEQTEAFVSSDLKSSKTMICRLDSSGQIARAPAGEPKGDEKSRAVSRRPMVRGKADMMDYIDRAISRIHVYVPPNPEYIDRLLQQGGRASLEKSEAGKSGIRFSGYFEEGDSFVFEYDSSSKVLRRVLVTSFLGSPKDPVTLEAVFEPLPDGVTHLSSAVLNAKKRRVQVKMRNFGYEKIAN